MAKETLIDFVKSKVNGLTYYKKEFPQWDGNHNSNVTCPFTGKHADGGDTRASFSVNINGTGGAYCHGCDTRVGSIIHYEKLRYGSKAEPINDELAATRIYSRFIRPVMAAPENVEGALHPFEVNLKGAPKVRKAIMEDLPVSDTTIDRFDLGWDNGLRRVTIPVHDKFSQLLNVRRYRLPSMRDDPKFPKLLNTDGFGSPAELFPAPQIFSICRTKHKPPVVYWMSGESDTLVAWDKGVPSFCYTTGENVCKKEWAEQIKELDVVIGIVQDNDDEKKNGERPGERGAKKRLEMLRAEGVTAFIVKMPEILQEKKVKDFRDYIKNGGTVKEFLTLGRNKKTEPTEDDTETEQENESPVEGGTEPEDHYFSPPRVTDPLKNPYAGEVAVADIGRTPNLLNRPITTRAVVSGKLDKTYSIPRVVECGGHQYLIPISREMLQMVREKDQKINELLHYWLNTKARIKIVSYITVTEVEIIPMIQPGKDTPYVNQRCYFFGAHIECNKPYLMKLVVTTDMRSQETLGLIYGIEPVSNVLDTYDFSEESCRRLYEAFNPGDEDAYTNLSELSHLVAAKYTHIFNRDDLHMVALLSWLSPLQFEFPYEGLQRGWLNSLIVGDTQTGKSEVCKKLTQLLHCGVFINAESCSYVGLVGGAVKSSSGMFILRWGKIPLYNRQLVVVEELSGLTTEEISYMSEVRSAGVARYDKAGLTGETPAKTRLVCLSNVRGEGRSLGDFNTGVQAAQSLIGHNEDLARFDLILTATDDEVNGHVINRDRSEEDDGQFTDDEIQAFRELIMFAWSLKPEQIDFTVGAYKACLKHTLSMSTEYHSSLPIFKAASGRLKLARLAVSIACIQFAWDFNSKKLVVNEKHVEAAAKVLHMLFKKPSFGYARYSKIQFDLQKVLHEDLVIAKIKEAFKGKELDLFNFVNNATAFTKWDLSEALGVHTMYVERVVSQMFMSNLLKKGERNEWQVSRAGRKWMERKITEWHK